MNAALHGTAVEIGRSAVLVIGPSGSGKSDLALRLIDRGALLVGDDYVEMEERQGTLLVRPDARLHGRMEVRGIGIFEMPVKEFSPLRLLVELGEDGERLPASWPLRDFHGWSLPLLRINGFAASAPRKIELALQSVVDEGLQPVRLTGFHDR